MLLIISLSFELCFQEGKKKNSKKINQVWCEKIGDSIFRQYRPPVYP